MFNGHNNASFRADETNHNFNPRRRQNYTISKEHKPQNTKKTDRALAEISMIAAA